MRRSDTWRVHASSAALALAWLLTAPGAALAEEAPPPPDAAPEATPAPAAEAPPAAPPQPRTFDLNGFQVEGCTVLTEAEVERVLLPFAGPGRPLEEVERARLALEKAYGERGYQTVSVAIPRQTVREGVVTLQVHEGRVGRLRVVGARWYSPRDIRRHAPSVAEGTVPSFFELVKDMVALNQQPDLRVSPQPRAGAEAGTLDVDLAVQDTLPLHGSLELNNRQSAATTPLRLTGGLHYDNLWQRGHVLTFTFQTAPLRTKDAQVFSGSYLARWLEWPGFTVGLNGVKQDSDVNTLGDLAIRGRGWTLGTRATFPLPSGADLFQTLTAGLDTKHATDRSGADAAPRTLVTWPVSAQYSATWSGAQGQTSLLATMTFNLGGAGSGARAFLEKRYLSSRTFTTWRGDLSRTQELPGGLQLFGRAQAQYADGPVPSAEQLTGGGADSVRGYREVEASGDLGSLGTVELRSPSASTWLGGPVLSDLRLVAFLDGAWLRSRRALPEQRHDFTLWSGGGGLRLGLLGHLTGSADLGVPLQATDNTARFSPRVHFRVSGEF